MLRTLPRIQAMQQKTLVDAVAIGMGMMMADKVHRGRIECLYDRLEAAATGRTERNRANRHEKGAKTQEQMHQEFVRRALDQIRLEKEKKDRDNRILELVKQTNPQMQVGS